MSARQRAWLHRWLISLLLGLAIGAISYLVVRAGTTAYLLYQQQQFFQETVYLLRNNGGIKSLAASNLREARLHVEALNAQYHRLSLHTGFAAAALGAVLVYLRLEHTAAVRHGDP